MVWTQDVVTSLRRLWADGISTARIGRELGFSKNAVVGKAHRLDLDPRPTPIPKRNRPPDPPIASILSPLPSLAVPQPSLEPACVVPIQPSPPVVAIAWRNPQPVDNLRHMPTPMPPLPSSQIGALRGKRECQWPFGEPGTKTFRFCCERALPGKPYCDDHNDLSHAKIRDRGEKAFS